MAEKMKVTHVSLPIPAGVPEARLLILADLHEQPRPDYLPAWEALEPTMVLIPGDWLEAARHTDGRAETLRLISALAGKYPVFYSLGNHEVGQRGNNPPRGSFPGPATGVASAEIARLIRESGAVLLDNSFTVRGGFVLGVLSPAGGGLIGVLWMQDFMRTEGYHILLCHHPEYYDPYIRDLTPELTVSGHTHGGQIRLFGRGLYAPGQGILPKYAGGVYDGGRLIVSRGLGNRYPIPRLHNPRESVLLELRHK